MTGWLIALGILLLIGFTRVRLRLQYDEGGLAASMRIGVFRVKLYPRPEKEKKPEKPKKNKEEPQKAKEREKRDFGVKFDGDALRDIIAIAKKALRRATRLARFELIELRFTSGGDDAAKVAIHYGTLNQIIYTIYPVLKRSLRIKKTNIGIFLDYTLPKSTYYGKLRLSVSIGRIVVFGFASAGSLLGFYLKHRNTTEREEFTNGRQQQQQAQAG